MHNMRARTPPLHIGHKSLHLGVLLLSPSEVYVRSCLYLLYTLIKLYYAKVLSNQASSLALD